MNSTSFAAKPTSTKIFVAIYAVLAAIDLFDFVQDRTLSNLVFAIGFALFGWAVWRSGVGAWNATGRRDRRLIMGGIAALLAGMVMRYGFGY